MKKFSNTLNSSSKSSFLTPIIEVPLVDGSVGKIDITRLTPHTVPTSDSSNSTKVVFVDNLAETEADKYVTMEVALSPSEFLLLLQKFGEETFGIRYNPQAARGKLTPEEIADIILDEDNSASVVVEKLKGNGVGLDQAIMTFMQVVDVEILEGETVMIQGKEESLIEVLSQISSVSDDNDLQAISSKLSEILSNKKSMDSLLKEKADAQEEHLQAKCDELKAESRAALDKYVTDKVPELLANDKLFTIQNAKITSTGKILGDVVDPANLGDCTESLEFDFTEILGMYPSSRGTLIVTKEHSVVFLLGKLVAA